MEDAMPMQSTLNNQSRATMGLLLWIHAVRKIKHIHGSEIYHFRESEKPLTPPCDVLPVLKPWAPESMLRAHHIWCKYLVLKSKTFQKCTPVSLLKNLFVPKSRFVLRFLYNMSGLHYRWKCIIFQSGMDFFKGKHNNGGIESSDFLRILTPFFLCPIVRGSRTGFAVATEMEEKVGLG